MTDSMVALCGFAGWTLALVFVLVNVRLLNSVSTGKALNSFSPAGGDLDGFGQRVTRAHLNCLEVLPVAAAVILGAAVSGNNAITDAWAMIFLWARIAQSVVHLVGTSTPLILIRGTFFFVQIVILAVWVYKLLTV